MLFRTVRPAPAQPLPTGTVYRRRTMTGAELQDMGYTHWKGQPIDPAEDYRVDVLHKAQTAVVHVRRALTMITNTTH